jgi:hypothetical protein
MGKSIMLKVGAIGTMLRVGRRHRGRHRLIPGSGGRTWPALMSRWTSKVPGQPQTGSEEHLYGGTAAADFYVVHPNVPALPGSIGS